MADWVRRLGRVYAIGRHSSAVIKGLKCALALRGVCGDFLAGPMHRFREPQRRQVRRVLDELDDTCRAPLHGGECA